MSLTRLPKDYQVLFLDMDAFFASCEQQTQPHLRGKPIGVSPSMAPSGSLIAASYEAKRFGVRTGMGLRQARMLCPDIIATPTHVSLYREIHHKILDILRDYSPWVAVKSIDEFAIKLSSTEQNEEQSVALAYELQNHICKELGVCLTSSFGIGPNKFLAKVAADINKPAGVTVVTIGSIDSIIGALPLSDLTGIGRGWVRRLRAEGIYTTAELLQRSPGDLRRIFGFPGEAWWYRLRGYEIDEGPSRHTTLSHSHVLEPKWRPPARAHDVLQRLAMRVGARLRRQGYWASCSNVYIRYVEGGGDHFHISSAPYCDGRTMVEFANRMFEQRLRKSEHILMLSFCVTGLQTAGARPQSLFPEREKPLHLSEAIDCVNDRFGEGSVLIASALNAANTAPDAIAFGRAETM